VASPSRCGLYAALGVGYGALYDFVREAPGLGVRAVWTVAISFQVRAGARAGNGFYSLSRRRFLLLSRQTVFTPLEDWRGEGRGGGRAVEGSPRRTARNVTVGHRATTEWTVPAHPRRRVRRPLRHGDAPAAVGEAGARWRRGGGGGGGGAARVRKDYSSCHGRFVRRRRCRRLLLLVRLFLIATCV